MNTSRLRIALVLPLVAPRPLGALKVVYRIAEWLTFWRHTVVVLHPERSLRSETGRAGENGIVAASSSQNTASACGDTHPWHTSRVQFDSRLVPLLADGHDEQTIEGVLGANFRRFYRRVEAATG